MPGIRNKGRRTRWLLTALGPVRFRRSYAIDSQGGQFPADAVLGIDGYLTIAAQRMASFVGTQESFARAQRTLRELCGWNLDDDIIRQLAHATARRAVHAGG